MAFHKWNRDVSIIGCGMTKCGNLAMDPDLKGMSERDLMAWAVLDACEDAGIQVKDIDASALGQTNVLMMNSLVMGQSLNHVLGAESKPAFSVVEGCATAMALCDIIGAKIASGQIDIGLVVAVATPASTADRVPGQYYKHPGKRVTTDTWIKNTYNSYDQAYWEHLAGPGGQTGVLSFQALRYARQYGLSFKEMDDVMNKITAIMREASVNHPCSMNAGGKTFAQIAAEKGFESDLDYLRSQKYNMHIAWPLRALNMPQLTDGAAALILCESSLAEKISKKVPIEISGIGQGAGIAFPPGGEIRYINYAEDGAKRQCFQMAGVEDPSEFEYMGLHDPMVVNHLTDSELVGYMKPGEAWKMIMANETRFDGRKPMQTHGGETQFGDCNDAAAVIDIIETVQQMRGECGPRQVPKIPRSAICVGRGVHSIGMMVLRNRLARR